MKKVKLVIMILSIASLVLTLFLPLLSSYMQNHYKNLLDSTSPNIQILLEKKQFWAQIGETRWFLYISLGLIAVFLFILLISWLQRR